MNPTDKKSIVDAMGHFAELHYQAMLDASNTRLSPAQRKTESALAWVYANAWFECNQLVTPYQQVCDDATPYHDPQTNLITVSVDQLQRIIAVAKEKGSEEPVHIATINGKLHAFCLHPKEHDGSIQLLLDNALITKSIL